jgi:GNAT superfamily N-acetyltransferase
MKVRVALDIDLLTLITLAESYASERDGRWCSLTFDMNRALKFGAMAIQDPNQQIFIAYEGSQVQGFMWVALTSPVWTSDIIAYDVFLYVHPEHRNLEVAKGLVGAFERWAKVCGAKVIHTGANSGIFKDNAAATLYEHLGYQSGGFNFYKDIKED